MLSRFNSCVFWLVWRVLWICDTKIVQNVLTCQSQSASKLRYDNLDMICFCHAIFYCFFADSLYLRNKHAYLYPLARFLLLFAGLFRLNVDGEFLWRMWIIPRPDKLLRYVKLIIIAIWLAFHLTYFLLNIVWRLCVHSWSAHLSF